MAVPLWGFNGREAGLSENPAKNFKRSNRERRLQEQEEASYASVGWGIGLACLWYAWKISQSGNLKVSGMGTGGLGGRKTCFSLHILLSCLNIVLLCVGMI